MAKAALVAGAGVALAGCGLWQTPEREAPALAPAGYAASADSAAPSPRWLTALDAEADQLSQLVSRALAANPTVGQLAAQRDQARAGWRIATSDRWPSASMNLRGSRSVVGRNQVAQAGQLFNLGLNVNWSADIWGQLSETQRAAALRASAAEARFENIRRSTAASVAQAWFNVMEARDLVALFERRLENLESSTAVVESGYRQGINEALDLYLARSVLAQERANLAAQRQTLNENVTALQALLGEYPDGSLIVDAPLPELEASIPVGLPSDLLVRRADVAEAWLNVLAADADVAVAQRSRLPQLSLSGSAGRVSQQLANIVSEGDESWSLVANLAGPLLDAGRLRAQVVQAKARAVETEKIYVNRLLGAFVEVENALSRSGQLKLQRDALIKARAAAQRALDLALEQYGRGLVDFTTVLESQRRAYDATTQVIRLQNQQLQNRIALHLAIGGEFELPVEQAAAVPPPQRIAK